MTRGGEIRETVAHPTWTATVMPDPRDACCVAPRSPWSCPSRGEKARFPPLRREHHKSPPCEGGVGLACDCLAAGPSDPPVSPLRKGGKGLYPPFVKGDGDFAADPRNNSRTNGNQRQSQLFITPGSDPRA